MTKVDFYYGRGTLPLDLPDDRLRGVLLSRAHGYKPPAPANELIGRALARPIGSPPLRELAAGKKNVVILVSDHTRPVPSRLILPPMLEEVRRGAPGARVTLLTATGCHRASTAAELEEKFGPELLAELPLAMHDAEKSDFVRVGRLPSGADLLLNRLAVEADLLLAEGFIEPHFFAGFSGGRKSVFPGCTNHVSVMANHCAAFIDHERARTGLLDGNPIHEDMLDAARQAALAFIVNVVVDADKRVVHAVAGHYDKAHRAGAALAAELAAVEAEPSDIVITTNGGWPMDQNLYQAVKGLTAAEAAVRPGGVIVMAARCEDGHGGEHFLRAFAEAGGPEAFRAAARSRRPEETRPDQWQAQILARVLGKARVVMVSEAPRAMTEALHMAPAPDLAEAFKMAEAWAGPRASVTAIPDGLGVIVRPAGV